MAHVLAAVNETRETRGVARGLAVVSRQETEKDATKTETAGKARSEK
jgi:hypothetical protein